MINSQITVTRVLVVDATEPQIGSLHIIDRLIDKLQLMLLEIVQAAMSVWLLRSMNYPSCIYELVKVYIHVAQM